MMPVEKLPEASWRTALGLGFVSAVFDNIPLTALSLEQGGYDWGMLAYAVGYGGSMLWFGSSAGGGGLDPVPPAASAGGPRVAGVAVVGGWGVRRPGACLSATPAPPLRAPAPPGGVLNA